MDLLGLIVCFAVILWVPTCLFQKCMMHKYDTDFSNISEKASGKVEYMRIRGHDGHRSRLELPDVIHVYRITMRSISVHIDQER